MIDGKEVAHLSYSTPKTVEYLQRQNEYTFFENTHEPTPWKGAFSGRMVESGEDTAARVLEAMIPCWPVAAG